MSEGVNRVMLLGNLGEDPELKETSAGAVLKLRLATTETFVDRNKERKERTDWHSVVMFGKRGEAIANYLKKGSKIFVEGALRTSSYEDKNKEKRWRTEVIASNIVFAGGGGGGEAAQSRWNRNYQPANQETATFERPDSDEIPF